MKKKITRRTALKTIGATTAMAVSGIGFPSILKASDNIKIGFLGLALVMEPIAKIWSPFLFDNYKKDDGPELIAKVFTINALVGFSACLMIAIMAPIIIPLITEESYHSAYKYVPYVCLAAVFWELASMADYGVLIKKKTIYKPFIFCAAALVAIISNFILVPLYAGIGAAISSVIGFFVLLIFEP